MVSAPALIFERLLLPLDEQALGHARATLSRHDDGLMSSGVALRRGAGGTLPTIPFVSDPRKLWRSQRRDGAIIRSGARVAPPLLPFVQSDSQSVTMLAAAFTR